MRKTKSTNPELITLVSFLKKKSRENKANIWLEVAEGLVKPKRKRVGVNLSRLNRYTKQGETAVVPGKVLGSGTITHPFTVAAFAFSEKAKDKLKAAKAKRLSIPELVEKNPKGTDVKIIG